MNTKEGLSFRSICLLFCFLILYSTIKKLLLVYALPAVLSAKIIVSNLILLLGTIYQVLYPQFHVTWLAMSIYLLPVYSILKEIDGLLDHMTGLLNRNTFQLVTAQQTHNGNKKRRTKAQAIVVFDIDRFKQIDDTLGHQMGEEYICRVAKMLKQSFGNYHRVFRIGGDEFAAILSGVTESDICRYLEKVERAVQKNQQKDRKFPTVSCGYAFTGMERGMEQAAKIADEKMYA